MRAVTYAKALKSVRTDAAFALQSHRPDMKLFCLAAIARYGITDTDVVIRLAGTISGLEPTVPSAARKAIAALRDQLLTAGKASAILANIRSIIENVQGSDALRP